MGAVSSAGFQTFQALTVPLSSVQWKPETKIYESGLSVSQELRQLAQKYASCSRFYTNSRVRCAFEELAMYLGECARLFEEAVEK
jgi:hypothetical protein